MPTYTDYQDTSLPDQVSAQISNAWDLVTTAFNQGLGTLSTLANQQYDLSWTPTAVESLESPSVSLEIPESPELAEVPDITATFEGTKPTADTITITGVSIPNYVEKNYGFSIPGAPVVYWPEFSKSPPAASDISIPSAPTFNIPEVPALSNVTIPAPPEYNIAAFDGVAPVDDLTVPSLDFSWGESLYSSDLKTKLGDWLYDQLVTGGTGLDETTEQAIYDRAKSRLEDEEQSLMDSINDGGASKGFPLPSGVHASRVLETENKILRSREDLNNDILIQQSKLAQENTHLVVQEASKLEAVLIDYHKSFQDRALDAAKFTVSTAKDLYLLRVSAYQARVQAYGILAQVYQARIQGEIAKAEFYRAQIEGVKASVSVQAALIDAYRAQVAGIAALVDVYKAQMEGANIQASIDETRMRGFLAEVQAYTARVQGEAAKYEGYKARISGEVAKADMQRADADAYIARVTGEKAKVDVQVSEAEARLARTRTLVEIFNGYVQKYSTDVQAQLAKADIASKREGLKVDLFRYQNERYNTELDALIKAYLGKVEEVKNKTGASIRESEVAVQTLLSRYQLTAENLRAISQIAGQMAAAAAASVNASLNAGYNESNSNSNQAVNTWSRNESVSESYNSVIEEIHSYSN